MEDNTWSFALSTSSSRCYQSAFKSNSDLYLDFEEIEEEEDNYDLRREYPCPYCTDDFDLVELCNHIDDEHCLEANSGECPVCFDRLLVDMVDHITTAHGTIYKSLERLKLRKSESHLTPFLKKDFQDEYLHASHGRSSSAVLSEKTALEPLLAFLQNVSAVEKSKSGQPACSSKITLEESSDAKPLERDDHSSTLSVEEHKEKAKRSEFVQGLLLSAMFDDDSRMKHNISIVDCHV